MLKTNKEKLAEISVQGEIVPPYSKHIVSYDGVSKATIGMGGICYNVKIGDSAFYWESDHLEPGVTIGLTKKGRHKKNFIRIPSCIGNKAKTTKKNKKEEGENEKDKRKKEKFEGVVTGIHSGVLIDFPDEKLEKLTVGDKILIRAKGLGLKLKNFPNVSVMNTDPSLLEKIVKEKEGKLEVNIVSKIPPELMGSGLGVSPSSKIVDYDIMTSEENALKKNGLEKLKLGDIVLIKDHFAKYGPCYKEGSTTIGVVVHADSKVAGHGPGVLPILTTKRSKKLELNEKEEAT